MKASELIKALKEQMQESGDAEVILLHPVTDSKGHLHSNCDEVGYSVDEDGPTIYLCDVDTADDLVGYLKAD